MWPGPQPTSSIEVPGATRTWSARKRRCERSEPTPNWSSLYTHGCANTRLMPATWSTMRREGYKAGAGPSLRCQRASGDLARSVLAPLERPQPDRLGGTDASPDPAPRRAAGWLLSRRPPTAVELVLA